MKYAVIFDYGDGGYVDKVFNSKVEAEAYIKEKEDDFAPDEEMYIEETER